MTTLNHKDVWEQRVQDLITYPQLVSSRLSPTWREAMPKSAILMLFFSSSNRFSGFRSLWLEKQWDKRENEITLCILGHTVSAGEKGNGVISEHPPPPYHTHPLWAPCPVTRVSPAGGRCESPLLCPHLFCSPPLAPIHLFCCQPPG